MSEQEISRAYDARRPLLEELKETLETKTNHALRGIKHIDRVSFRVKDRTSFIRKATKPKYSEPLIELEDQVAGRIITFFRQDIVILRERLSAEFVDVEHVIREPVEANSFDYESDHYVFVIPEHWKPEGWTDQDKMPTTFELQVRTLFMHAWAEPQHDLGYRTESDLSRDEKRELAWIAASAWGADRTLNDIAERLGAFD